MNERAIVLDILVELDKGDGYTDRLIKDTLDKYDYLETREKSFIKRLSEGVVEKRITLDYVIDTFSKCKTTKMRPIVKQIMRMGVYQILYMDSVPDSAACNESVKLAQKKGFSSLKGFVNGVLRSVSRGQGNILFPDASKNWSYAMSVIHSMPEDTVKMIDSWYGHEKSEKILSDFDLIRPVTIRVCDEAGFSELLKTPEWGKANPLQNQYLPYAYTVNGTEGISSLPGFDEGVFNVQDAGSMLVAEAAEIEEGQILLDVCAAPGGKACQCAQKLADACQSADSHVDACQSAGKMNDAENCMTTDKSHITACDISADRAERINENMIRLGIKNMDVKVCDACEFIPEFENSADIVFADVPCSGLGVAGRKPDIKYHVTRESIKVLTELQWKIVSNVCRYVKPGGTFIYSTCTISPDENVKMAERIAAELGMDQVSILDRLSDALKSDLDDDSLKMAEKGCLQLLPGIQKTDGFFIAKFRKSMNK